MTLGEIRTAVRERLDDPTFETQKIDRWANWVIQDIYARCELPFMKESATFTTISGQQAYPLSSVANDIGRVRSVIDMTNEYTLQYVDNIALNEKYKDMSDDGNDSPTMWTITDDSIILYPTPDDTYTIKVFYKKTPSLLSVSTDVAEIPDRYAEIIVLGVYQKAHEWNDDYDYAAVIERQYEQKIIKMLNDYKETSGQVSEIPYGRPEIG